MRSACGRGSDAQEYFDGAMDAEKSREFRLHLEGCPGCRARIEGYGAIGAALSDLNPGPVPAVLHERLMGIVPVAAPRRVRIWAAAALLAASSVLFWLMFMPFSAGTGMPNPGDGGLLSPVRELNRIGGMVGENVESVASSVRDFAEVDLDIGAAVPLEGGTLAAVFAAMVAATAFVNAAAYRRYRAAARGPAAGGMTERRTT